MLPIVRTLSGFYEEAEETCPTVRPSPLPPGLFILYAETLAVGPEGSSGVKSHLQRGQIEEASSLPLISTIPGGEARAHVPPRISAGAAVNARSAE